MNLKDLNLKDLVKLGIAITATLLLTLNFAISIQNTTIINNYAKETKQQFDETKQDIATTNQTVNKVQENVTKIKTDQIRELSIQREILRQVD